MNFQTVFQMFGQRVSSLVNAICKKAQVRDRHYSVAQELLAGFPVRLHNR